MNNKVLINNMEDNTYSEEIKYIINSNIDKRFKDIILKYINDEI